MKQINLQENLRKKFDNQGVKMTAPETVFFSKDTRMGKFYEQTLHRFQNYKELTDLL